MDQITGALIAIALVLSAVFLPMAFFGGSTGVIYRQFSLTIVSAMALSVLVALILTPALCADDPQAAGDPLKHEGNGPLARFFRWFNDRFDRGRAASTSAACARCIGRKRRSALVYAAIVRGHGAAVLAPADRLPARRGPRRRSSPWSPTRRRDPAAHR